MSRLTKGDIEQKLLSAAAIEWRDLSQKRQRLQLKTAKERRLFKFLLSSTVRAPTGLQTAFLDDLVSAFSGTEDPASETEINGPAVPKSIWKLHTIETTGFGGLNTWGDDKNCA